jgi:hypothetical protein
MPGLWGLARLDPSRQLLIEVVPPIGQHAARLSAPDSTSRVFAGHARHNIAVHVQSYRH